ncbi:hypothetical protein TNCV_3326041 [Trichonephila clavipes]|nr:hypothetical protein TNCV_3326041 [Trichonephila clavipes]
MFSISALDTTINGTTNVLLLIVVCVQNDRQIGPLHVDVGHNALRFFVRLFSEFEQCCQMSSLSLFSHAELDIGHLLQLFSSADYRQLF